ncbi:MAG: OmpA family protein [Sulfurimonas sp.]
MKKLLLVSALLSSVLLAEQKQYEISPMFGYNLTEGNIGIKDDSHLLGALEVQFNSPDSKISPEFSILYSPKAKYRGGGDSAITRGAFNGVYTFDSVDNLTPFAKAGIGIENVSDETDANQDGFFLDAGAGVKYALNDNFALKAEAIYLAKVAHHNAGSFDSNLIAMVGLNFAFGDYAQKAAPVKEEVKPVEEPKQEEPVAAAPAPVVQDDDNDGVMNPDDKCPNTIAGAEVDANGCNIDSDKDGIINSQDICPNTPLGAKVNSDGCPKVEKLAINFANNSAQIKDDSNAKLDKYADFLTTYTNYSAKIVGYTDSRGSAAYNQKLSERRAAAVVEALKARGVQATQLSSKGMGEANPVADNATAEGRAQNRRIEAELTRN